MLYLTQTIKTYGQFSESALPVLTFFQKIQNGFLEIKVTFRES